MLLFSLRNLTLLLLGFVLSLEGQAVSKKTTCNTLMRTFASKRQTPLVQTLNLQRHERILVPTNDHRLVGVPKYVSQDMFTTSGEKFFEFLKSSDQSHYNVHIVRLNSDSLLMILGETPYLVSATKHLNKFRVSPLTIPQASHTIEQALGSKNRRGIQDGDTRRRSLESWAIRLSDVQKNDLVELFDSNQAQGKPVKITQRHLRLETPARSQQEALQSNLQAIDLLGPRVLGVKELAGEAADVTGFTSVAMGVVRAVIESILFFR